MTNAGLIALCAACLSGCGGEVGGDSQSNGDAGADAGSADAATPERPAPRVEAAVAWATDKRYLFAGSDYIRYDMAAGSADSGYPRAIDGAWPGLFASDIDAACRVGDRAHFFRGSQYLRYDIGADRADDGYPMATADAWPGLGDGALDAAFAAGGKIYFLRGGELWRWDVAGESIDTGYPKPVAQALPGVWPDPDAALADGDAAVYLFRGAEYLRFDLTAGTVDDGYPRAIPWYWPGLFDPFEGTGVPGDNLPDAVAALLLDEPDAGEIAARKARVAASADGYEDLTASYPQFVASVEAELGIWGCGLLRSLSDPSVHRFRCATDTSGAIGIDIARLTVDYVDWRTAAHHEAQVSQGDFSAAAGTPLSIFAADDDVFYIERVTANAPTGSINGGLNVRVRYLEDGVERQIGFSHLNGKVPQYVLDAAADGGSLPVGTVFGFIGYTGNLWIAAPPATDAPYDGGGGLPVSHSHLWFVDDLDNHLALTPRTREAIDYSGTYFYGGG